MTQFTLDDVRAACKARDTWWTVLVVDPLACRLALMTANRTRLTPNRITLVAFALGMAAAVCFARAGWPWLIAGAILYHLSFVADCVDGKIARLKDTGTVFGGWLDFTCDRIRTTVCALALTIGQYLATGRAVFLLLGFGLLVVNGVRYANNPRIARAKSAMNDDLKRMSRTLASSDEDEEGEGPPKVKRGPAAARARKKKRVDLHRGLRSRFPWYLRVRARLLRRRINPHLMGGIEFEMLIFVVAPLLGPGALIPVFLAVAPFRLLFELALVYRFWLSNKDYERSAATLRARLEAALMSRVGQEAAWTSSSSSRE